MKLFEGYIKEDGWYYDIIDEIPDAYTKGYVTAKLEELSENLSTSWETFREEFIDVIENYT